eukprot:scaffold2441_cov105-Cylindrotheca_fusiformis.AAC.10
MASIIESVNGDLPTPKFQRKRKFDGEELSGSVIKPPRPSVDRSGGPSLKQPRSSMNDASNVKEQTVIELFAENIIHVYKLPKNLPMHLFQKFFRRAFSETYLDVPKIKHCFIRGLVGDALVEFETAKDAMRAQKVLDGAAFGFEHIVAQGYEARLCSPFIRHLREEMFDFGVVGQVWIKMKSKAQEPHKPCPQNETIGASTLEKESLLQNNVLPKLPVNGQNHQTKGDMKLVHPESFQPFPQTGNESSPVFEKSVSSIGELFARRDKQKLGKLEPKNEDPNGPLLRNENEVTIVQPESTNVTLSVSLEECISDILADVCNTDLSQKKTLEEEKSLVTKQTDSMPDEEKRLRGKIKDLEAKMRAIQAQNDFLEQELHRKRHHPVQLNSQLSYLKNALRKSRIETKSLSFSKLQQELDQTELHVKELQEENNRLRKKPAKDCQQYKEALSRAKKLRAEMKKMERKHLLAIAGPEELKDKLASTEEKLQFLEQKNERLSQELNRILKQCSEVKSKVRSMKKEIGAIEGVWKDQKNGLMIVKMKRKLEQNRLHLKRLQKENRLLKGKKQEGKPKMRYEQVLQAIDELSEEMEQKELNNALELGSMYGY